jgi:hypothetical protein
MNHLMVVLGLLVCLSAPSFAHQPHHSCGTCPAPHVLDWGLTFKDGDLWVIDEYGRLYHLQECSVIETIHLPGEVVRPGGLGYDTARQLFIVADLARDVVHQVDPDGVVVNTWPLLSLIVPSGAAYDPRRDLYWIADSYHDRMEIRRPDGELVEVTPVPAGTRISGAGYDSANDAIFYCGRDQNHVYWMSAEDGTLLDWWQNPGGPGHQNNGRGTAIDPQTHNGWVSHTELDEILCIEGLEAPTATERYTWGRIKSLYR